MQIDDGEYAALLKDALRYRWLRSTVSSPRPDDWHAVRWTVAREQSGMGQTYSGDRLDAAIDAAREPGE